MHAGALQEESALALFCNEISDFQGDYDEARSKNFARGRCFRRSQRHRQGSGQCSGRPEIVVNVPFEFVASGKTLPAGTYTVNRISEDQFGNLLLSNYEKHVSVLVHPVEFEDARADKASVSFERVGESRFLTKISTANAVYTIPVSGVAIIDEAR